MSILARQNLSHSVTSGMTRRRLDRGLVEAHFEETNYEDQGR